MTMTPEGREALRKLVRGGHNRDAGLRRLLLDRLDEALESRYRLGIRRTADAGLSQADSVRRDRLVAWLRQQERAGVGAARARASIVEQAASTWLNRLVVLRILEAQGLRRPLVTGGWKSPGWRAFSDVAPGVTEDESRGMAVVLGLVFEDLAVELPGLFGSVGLTDLVSVPPAVLRALLEALDDPALESCWTDDTTLGWIYQYWNDPAREALDAKLNSGGKVEPHELASKTQMFTERYMVEWLLQNSLGQTWLAMCAGQGWTPACRSEGTLDALEERRVAWRAKRDTGEVPLDALMPLHTDAERRWCYWVPQPLPQDAVARAPESLRTLKLLDPAVGSGHFLVIACDLLVALHAEEDRHRGTSRSLREIVVNVLEDNLHGLDLDPRAVQIAAAALWLKARTLLHGAGDTAPLRLRRLNLVASNLQLGRLPTDDPARERLRQALEREAGLSGALTDQLLDALSGADHLGSLLKVDAAVGEALSGRDTQGGLFSGPTAGTASRDVVLEAVEALLSRHTRSDDLGLRLDSEQLAAGVRFVRMVREGTYDVVVGNPPYQGTSKMKDAAYVKRHYKDGKADLYAAFLLRGLELVREGGVSALVTMRNWMFIKQFTALREGLLERCDLRVLGDVDRGAFDEVPNEVLAAAMSVFRRAAPSGEVSVAMQPTPLDDKSYDRERTKRKRAAVLGGVGRFEFESTRCADIEGLPLLYWWSAADYDAYTASPRLGTVCPAKEGLGTRNDTRFIRRPWEPLDHTIMLQDLESHMSWSPLVMGAAGKAWCEPVSHLLSWGIRRLSLVTWIDHYRKRSPGQYIKNESYYFQPGVAFSTIGNSFSARLHRVPSIFGERGSSVFPDDPGATVCAMNRSTSRSILQDLNPTITFKIGDIDRLPVPTVSRANHIVSLFCGAFTLHESHREPSVEFTHPGPSPWRHAQDWAQLAVDRPQGAPLPEYVEELDPEPDTDHLSYALGVALGRFGPNGEGILDPTTADLSHALPAGLLYLSSFDPDHDGLSHPACQLLRDTWAERFTGDLHTTLRTKFFDAVHRPMYENKPIHWPLTSAKKRFVAWVTIHRLDGDTLRTLIARHLEPDRVAMEARLSDLRTAQDTGDRAAERTLDKLVPLHTELCDFIEAVRQCAERGPPPTDPRKCPPRDADARYDPDLDDGVMINSAALWPLLQPQWKKPKQWWTELASAKGKKDYDWSHLAAKYWPDRVDDKCQRDPSLGVAHGCFWRYHPARAWAWELRLGLELEPGFTIDEADSDAGRQALLAQHPDGALAALDKEVARRNRKDLDLAVHLPVAGVWAKHGEALAALEVALTEKKSTKAPVSFPEPGGGRAVFLAAHPSLARAVAQAHAAHGGGSLPLGRA